MGQNQSETSQPVPIYADDGITVIGMTTGKEAGCVVDQHYDSSEQQRWFDWPGPQAQTVKQMPPQTFLPIAPENGFGEDEQQQQYIAVSTSTQVVEVPLCESGFHMSSLSGQLLDKQTMQHVDGQILKAFVVRNCTSQPLLISNGGMSIKVAKKSSTRMKLSDSSVQVRHVDSGKVLCELEGLPLDNAFDSGVAVVLSEIGATICASLDYNYTDQGREKISWPMPAAQILSDSVELDEPPQAAAEQIAWEARLQTAMARGDEDAVREALKHL